jgi:hypothetical protein
MLCRMLLTILFGLALSSPATAQSVGNVLEQAGLLGL